MFTRQSVEVVVERKIRQELSFMKLDENGVREFVSEYTKNMSWKTKLALKSFALSPLTSRQSRKIHRLMTMYILSTDFFDNGMDESRTVKYIAIYDPQGRPCINPFSYAHYKDA